MKYKFVSNFNFSKDKPLLVFELALLFKFLLFNIIWCLSTTFSSLSTIEFYLNNFLVINILIIPLAIFRSKKAESVILFLIDTFFIVNLMYFRTYFTQIPLASYGLASNLSDFTASVVDSIRIWDLLFPISSIVAIILAHHVSDIVAVSRRCFSIRLLALFLLSYAIVLFQGGFVPACDSLMQANMHTCRTPMYTLFGALYYDYEQKDVDFTPQTKAEIEEWLNERPDYQSIQDTISGKRYNCVLILAESFESWVLERSVEGNDITPYLNGMIKDSTTLYAPKVLTQVRGGRSIDAQLMVEAGMLPISSGSYSLRYTGNRFFTLPKAMKNAFDARSYLLTVDKEITWNQNMVARAFGIDTILAKQCFVNDEKVGTKKKLGDVSFFRQCKEKMERGEIWPVGTNAFLQCVTYSGHNPFVLPEKLKKINLSESYPQKIRDYVAMANYTDRAIGLFIEYLKTRPDYKNTIVVITGDHEGLAGYRAALANDAKCKGLVSPKQFTPLIILNSPVAGRYDKVMGQIDIYPTVLNLMQLDSYKWKGIGQSIVDIRKKGIAVGSQMNVESDEKECDETQKETDRMKQAWRVSDLMIRCDYFGHTYGKDE